MTATFVYKQAGVRDSRIVELTVPDGYEAPPSVKVPILENGGAESHRTFVLVVPGIDEDGEVERRARPLRVALARNDFEAFDAGLTDLSADVLAAIADGRLQGDDAARAASGLQALTAACRLARQSGEGHSDD